MWHVLSMNATLIVVFVHNFHCSAIGNFGEVHIGQLTDECNKAKSTHVAIKTIRGPYISRTIFSF